MSHDTAYLPNNGQSKIGYIYTRKRRFEDMETKTKSVLENLTINNNDIKFDQEIC